MFSSSVSGLAVGTGYSLGNSVPLGTAAGLRPSNYGSNVAASMTSYPASVGGSIPMISRLNATGSAGLQTSLSAYGIPAFSYAPVPTSGGYYAGTAINASSPVQSAAAIGNVSIPYGIEPFRGSGAPRSTAAFGAIVVSVAAAVLLF